MHSTLLFALLSSISTAVFAADSCICTQFSQITSAVADCTDITLQDIVAPSNNTINLAKLKDNSVVTFAGTTSFEFTNSSDFIPISFGGKNVTITMAPGGVIEGNGSIYWDGLGSNGGLPKYIKILVNELTHAYMTTDQTHSLKSN